MQGKMEFIRTCILEFHPVRKWHDVGTEVIQFKSTGSLILHCMYANSSVANGIYFQER